MRSRSRFALAPHARAQRFPPPFPQMPATAAGARPFPAETRCRDTIPLLAAKTWPRPPGNLPARSFRSRAHARPASPASGFGRGQPTAGRRARARTRATSSYPRASPRGCALEQHWRDHHSPAPDVTDACLRGSRPRSGKRSTAATPADDTRRPRRSAERSARPLGLHPWRRSRT